MMLAGAVHLDVTDQHHLVVLSVEYRREHFLGALPHPGELLGVAPRHPRRGIDQAIAIGVFPDGDQNLADRPLYPVMIDIRKAVRLIRGRVPAHYADPAGESVCLVPGRLILAPSGRPAANTGLAVG